MITYTRFYFVLLCCIGSVLGMAQSTNSTNKEAKALLKQAGQSFLNLDTKKSEYITTLPTPSLVQVAAVAYDESYKKLFYTTNNNQLYRDVWEYDLNSSKEKLLFKDSRIGQLTISENKHELWGIQHLSGKAILVKSKYPLSLHSFSLLLNSLSTIICNCFLYSLSKAT